MSLGIATLQQTGEFLFVEQPVEIEPAVEASVGSLEETGTRRRLEGRLPAVEPARLGEALRQSPAAHGVQEHHLRPALARRRLLPEREGLIDRGFLRRYSLSLSLSLSLSRATSRTRDRHRRLFLPPFQGTGAMADAGRPRLVCDFRENRMIETAVAALHPAAQRLIADASEDLEAEAGMVG